MHAWSCLSRWITVLPFGRENFRHFLHTRDASFSKPREMYLEMNWRERADGSELMSASVHLDEEEVAQARPKVHCEVCSSIRYDHHSLGCLSPRWMVRADICREESSWWLGSPRNNHWSRWCFHVASVSCLRWRGGVCLRATAPRRLNQLVTFRDCCTSEQSVLPAHRRGNHRQKAEIEILVHQVLKEFLL